MKNNLIKILNWQNIQTQWNITCWEMLGNNILANLFFHINTWKCNYAMCMLYVKNNENYLLLWGLYVWLLRDSHGDVIFISNVGFETD